MRFFMLVREEDLDYYITNSGFFQPMRVLVLTTAYRPLIGGSEIAIEELTRRIPDIFFDIVTPRYRHDSLRVEQDGNRTIYRTGMKAFFLLTGFYRALQLHRQYRYTIVHAQQASYGAVIGYLLKTFFPGVRFIVTLQEGKDLSKQHFLIRYVRWLILKRADVITAISTYLRQFAENTNPTAKHVLLPNGVTVAQFSLHAEPSGERYSVISISRLVPKNGMDTLIRAMQYVESPHTLCIVGDGEQRSALQLVAEEAGVSSRVIFYGEASNDALPSLLARATVFARPSRSEGLGIAFLEAMAARVPVVATPVGGIPDIVKNKRTGLFCEIDNPESVGAAINKLLRDEGLRTKLTTEAFLMVTEHYDWDILAKQYQSLLTS